LRKPARFLNNKVPGIFVPDNLIAELDNSKEPIKKGIEIAIKSISELKGLCSGVHIMTVGQEELVLEILKGVL